MPQHLRTLGSLTGEVIFAGLGNRIEIWDKDKWLAAKTYDDVDEAAAAMEGFGI